MKIKVFKFLNIFLLLLLTYLAFPAYIIAADRFEDNFNSYLEGTEDLKRNWEEFTFPWETKCVSPWVIENGWIGIKIKNNECQTNLKPKYLAKNLNNTFFADFDIKLVEGSDRNFIYSYDENNLDKGFYELHFQSPGDLTISLPKGHYILNIPSSYPINNTYHVKLIINKKSLQVLINDVLVKDYLADEEFPPGNIAFRVGTGGDPNSETWFDNLIVSQLSTSNIEIPLIKQSEEPWQSNVYDHSNNWSPFKNSIKDWGCALTSASMILNYYGIKEFPNGTKIDPGSLNKWLIEQDDGYVMNGYLNWQAISRLSRLSVPQNKITSFKALEYNRHYGNFQQEIQMKIKDRIPVIVQEIPMHFVVGKNIEDKTVSINDPFFSKETLLLDKDGVTSLITFSPSNTDLSYLILLGNEKNNFFLLDKLHKKINESRVIGPLTSDTDGSASNPFSILENQKMVNGKYFLKVTLDKLGFSHVEFFFYDQDGNFIKSTKEVLSDREGTSFVLIYDKTNLSKIKVSKESTPLVFKKDVERLTKLKYVNSKLGKTLIKLMSSIEKNARSKRKVAVNFKIIILKETIKNSPNILFHKAAKRVLLEDLENLQVR